MNPVEMTQKDEIAEELLEKYATQMANQSVGGDEARALLEFFRQTDSAAEQRKK
jgi:hypothetical protein